MNNNINNLVTIVIPTYNRISYLKESLNSALLQTYQNLEIIICDNNSTDGTFEFCSSLKDDRVYYLRQNTSINPLKNWNSWVEFSNGYYVTFLPDDDKLKPYFIEKCLALLAEDNNAGFVKAGCDIINGNGKVINKYIPFKENSSSSFQYILDRINPRYNELSLGSGYLFKKKDFVKVGGFKDVGFKKMHFVDDYLWFSLAMEYEHVLYINEILWSYREHSSNMALVENLNTFKIELETYSTLLAKLAHKYLIKFNTIEDYIFQEYTKYIFSQRVIGEVSRMRHSSSFVSIKFILKNKKILIQEIGFKKIAFEFLLNLIKIKF
jgi:glycosyltransferase involved in cell wall biosynthesis